MIKRLNKKSLKPEKRIVSVFEKIDIMRFIVEEISSLSPEIECLSWFIISTLNFKL